MTGKTELFRTLHTQDTPLLLANAWDAGSARILEFLGYQALATTSGGFAGTLGRFDGTVTRDEAIAHSAALAAAVDIPVSADLEDCFAEAPEGVAETVRLAVDAGLAGCSVEDFTRDETAPIYELSLAAERVEAAVDAAAGQLVITARAENHIHGVTDLADTIARLQAFQEAGADVLFAPGVIGLDDLRTVVAAVDRPVNVLVLPGAPTVAELGAVGVKRISVGSGFGLVAYGAAIDAAQELLRDGTLNWWAGAMKAMAARDAFKPR